MQHLALRGATIKLVSVDSLGHVRLDELEQLLSSSTTQLVSIQVANNEIGTIQNIVEIAELVHRYGALLHCDATQAIGRMHIDVELLNVDYLSFSAHKLYGPKGAAALYIRGGPKKSSLSPIMFGGGQEDGLRPGTINVPGVVGFATAAQLAMNEMLEELPRIRRQRDELEVRLLTSGFDIRRNGDVSNRLDSNSSLTFPVEAEALVARLPNFALSLGSACQSGALEPSPVLKAIGLTRNAAYQTIRIGIGRFTTNAEIDALACELLRHVFEVSSMKF
jgi:cysteine desulfurase